MLTKALSYCSFYIAPANRKAHVFPWNSKSQSGLFEIILTGKYKKYFVCRSTRRLKNLLVIPWTVNPVWFCKAARLYRHRLCLALLKLRASCVLLLDAPWWHYDPLWYAFLHGNHVAVFFLICLAEMFSSSVCFRYIIKGAVWYVYQAFPVNSPYKIVYFIFPG